MGLFGRSGSNVQQKKKGAPKIKFSDVDADVRAYEFDWELERDYWYTKEELKEMKDVRLKDAAVLRKERDIKVATRDDADALSGSRRGIFIGDSITHALDDKDENEKVSCQGIEHFVWPVLQKEMVNRKKEVKAAVISFSRDPKRYNNANSQGEKLAEASAKLSQWARDVATERGLKYCQMKRGGRGGGLLAMTKNAKMNKGMRGTGTFKREMSVHLKRGRGLN